MLAMTAKWPKWLFYITLLFWFLLLNVGYVNNSKRTRLAHSTQQLQTAIGDYDELIAAIPSVTQNNVKTSFVSVPIQFQDCGNNFFGIMSCAPVSKLSQQELYAPTGELDPAVQDKVVKLNSRITTLVAEANNAHSDVEKFNPLSDFIMNIMKPFFSVVVLISSLFIILSKRYQDDTQKWAFGSLGTVLGFWLK
jgi:hypothetical protein